MIAKTAAWILPVLAALSVGRASPAFCQGTGGIPNESRHRFFSVDLDLLAPTLIGVDLPAELEFTPTHPDDVDRFRPPRSLPTPLSDRQWALVQRVGVSTRPLPFPVLRNVGVGYSVAFFVYGDRISDDFRQGTLLSRRPYAYFICGGPFNLQCEEAYTYTVVESIAPLQDLRAYYRFTLASDSQGEGENRWGHRVSLIAGIKYSWRSVVVRQGWDRYNKDEVFRRTRGIGQSLQPWIQATFDLSPTAAISLGVEREATPLRFDGVLEPGSLRGASFRYSFVWSF